MGVGVSPQPQIVEHRVEHLVPGMEIARDIYAEQGSILVCRGTIATTETIAQLKKWTIEKVHTVAQATVTPISDPKLKQFVKQYNNSISVVQNAFEAMRETGEIPIDELSAAAEEIADGITEAGNVVDQLYNLPPCDDYTFHHCVNVSIISALIAVWLKYPQDLVNAISLAGLMHDVGKSQLPSRILNTPHRLAPQDYALYQQHTIFGAELARKMPNMAESILAGIAEHHEREDGSGYPLGVRGDEIHPYAKIVAVADVYDERLTIDRKQDVVLSPYTSLELLRDEIYKFDAKACIRFAENMINYIAGDRVALTDGRIGRVVFLNERFPSRCMVQLDDGTVLDLASEPYLRIHHLIR